MRYLIRWIIMMQINRVFNWLEIAGSAYGVDHHIKWKVRRLRLLWNWHLILSFLWYDTRIGAKDDVYIPLLFALQSKKVYVPLTVAVGDTVSFSWKGKVFFLHFTRQKKKKKKFQWQHLSFTMLWHSVISKIVVWYNSGTHSLDLLPSDKCPTANTTGIQVLVPAMKHGNFTWDASKPGTVRFKLCW